MKEEIFISTLTIILLFNVFAYSVNATDVSLLNLDFTDLVVTAVAIVLPLSINFLGVGLSDSGISIAFAVMIVFNVLFQIEIYGYTIGLGLINTMINVFSGGNDVLNLGFMITSILGMLAFFSGMLIIVGD